MAFEWKAPKDIWKGEGIYHLTFNVACDNLKLGTIRGRSKEEIAAVVQPLLDYYFVLKSLNPDAAQSGIEVATMGMWDEGLASGIRSKTELMHTLSAFGMKPFAGAVMWVLQEVFALPSQYLICAPDAKRGEFLLNEIMLAGNFGKYDERNVIGANEGYLKRFVRRQKRFLRFLTQYPSEVIWGPYFTVKQRAWRMWHGWK